MPDDALVQQYKQSKDQQFLAILYQRYSGLIFGVCLKYLKDPEASADASLDIYEELTQKVLKYEIDTFKGWLHTLTRNHCLMKLRSGKNKHTVELQEQIMQIEETVHLNGVMEKETHLTQLEGCIEKLNNEQKQVVRLFYLQEKCYNDITAETGLPWNVVRSHIQNGRRNLKYVWTNMPANNPHTTVYSAADLLLYATGRMTAPEMHAVEKAALEDPFLAEALEGYMEAAGVQSQPVLQTNINKLTPVTEQKSERKTIPLWRKKAFQYAAAAVLILGGGWATYSLLNPSNNEQQSVASAPVNKQTETAATDTANTILPDASSTTPVQQAPAEAERDAYANAETNEAPPDIAMQQPLQQANTVPQKQTTVQDTVAMNRADNTSVDMDDVAKKEMKDASPPLQAAKPVPSANETASESQATQRQQSGTLARAKSSRSEAEPRNVFRGRITDAKNNPLPYANVMISGENVGTYTDSKRQLQYYL